MSKTKVVFVPEKSFDFGNFHRFKDCEVGRNTTDYGRCSSCGEAVFKGAERCENCGAEFGRWFDLGGVI